MLKLNNKPPELLVRSRVAHDDLNVGAQERPLAGVPYSAGLDVGLGEVEDRLEHTAQALLTTGQQPDTLIEWIEIVRERFPNLR